MFDVKNDDDLYTALCFTIRTRVPRFKVRFKKQSAWQRFLGVLLFFVKGGGYVSSCVTTLGDTVWFPSKEFVTKDKLRAFKILAHEYVHLLDGQKHPVVFDVAYAFPQLLAIFSVLAVLATFLSLWWLTALVALVFLAPWPAPGRLELEKRGYAMGLAINIWRHGTVRDNKDRELADILCGSTYYWMTRDRGEILEWVAEQEVLIRNVDKIGNPKTIFQASQAYQDVYEMLTGIELDE